MPTESSMGYPQLPNLSFELPHLVQLVGFLYTMGMIREPAQLVRFDNRVPACFRVDFLKFLRNPEDDSVSPRFIELLNNNHPLQEAFDEAFSVKCEPLRRLIQKMHRWC